MVEEKHEGGGIRSPPPGKIGLRNFAKFVLLVFSRNLNISRKKFVLTESSDQVL